MPRENGARLLAFGPLSERRDPASNGSPGGLRFRMLGPFEAYRGEERIPPQAFRTRQALALLKILLDARDRTVPSARLVELLWPDSDPDAGRHSLQVAVAAVRTALEPGLRRGTASRYVVTEDPGYRLVEDGVQIDVDALLRAARAGARAEREGDDGAAIDAYRIATSLYHGEYLAEDQVAEWVLPTRERVRATYLDASVRLGRLLAKAGAQDEAAVVLEQALAVDPLREELYQELMRAHIGAQRRSHALAVYERCRLTLHAELGVEPSAATRAIREEAREERGATRQPRAAVELRLPFVGRERELARLSEAWERSAREGGVVVILEGEAGEGKTHAVRRFANVLGSPVRTLWLAGHESEKDVPYTPLRALVSGWLDRTAGAALVPRLGQHAGALAQLVPAVRDVWPDAPQAEERVDDVLAAEAFTRALLLMKGPGRALAVLDDVHWMDDATVRWLPYALRRESPGLLVVLTRRPSEPGPASLDAVLADLQRRSAVSVRLAPLSGDDLEQLATPVSGPGAQARAFASRLQHATSGNALFAVETLRELWQRGALPTDLPVIPIAPTLRDAVAARLARLPRASRDALAAIAVLDAPAPPDAIAATASLSAEESLAALEVLLRAQLARPSDDGRRYGAEHPLIARATYDAISAPRRAELHVRAAGVLRDAPVARLRHLALGGMPREQLIAEAESAGAAALAAGRAADALTCFDRAYHLLGTSGSDRDRRVRVIEGLAETLQAIGRWAEAEARCRELLDDTDDPLIRSRLRRRIALSHGDIQGDFGAALAHLDAAAAELDGREGEDVPLELGRVESARMTVHHFRSDLASALAHGERALALLSDDPRATRDVARLLDGLGLLNQRMGRLDVAERYYREGARHARAVGDALVEATSNAGLGATLVHRGRVREGRALKRGALETYRACAATKLEAIALADVGWSEREAGDLPASYEAYEASIALAESLGARFTVMHSLVGAGQVLVDLGRFARARADLERGIALAEEIGSLRRAAHAHIYLAELALAQGDAATAVDHIARATAIGEQVGDAHTTREGQPVLARALLALGDPAGGAAAARRALDQSLTTGFVLSEGRARVALGECLARLGDAAAKKEFARAVALFRAAAASHELAIALHAQATALPPGRRRAAAEDLAEAATLARECGARPLMRQVEEASNQARRSRLSGL